MTQPDTPRAREWEPAFLTAFRASANVAAACRAAGISRTTAYEHRNASPTFAAAWEQAHADYVDALELRASRIALEDGSEQMIRWMLPRLRPDKWADPEKRIELTGAGGGPMQIESTVHTPDPATWAEILAIRERLEEE